MSLHAKLVGSGRPQLVFLHGLFGQGRNWNGIALALQPDVPCLLMDLPNHGHSPNTADFSYTDMAGEVYREFEARLGSAASVTVVGHSMGGKVAMMMALLHPELVKGLVVVDIAPDDTGNGYGFVKIVNALRGLDLASLTSREEASELIADAVPEEHVRDFLLQNLRRKKKGGWHWLMNLDLIAASLPRISGWPAEVTGTYEGPTLFLRGAQSDYITDADLPRIAELFPRSRVVTVEDAGHWVHAQQPEVVISSIREFLAENDLVTPPLL